MRSGFSTEYAPEAKLARRTWELSDDEDRSWRQKLEMLLLNLIEDEHDLERAIEDAAELRVACDRLLIELQHPVKPVPTAAVRVDTEPKRSGRKLKAFELPENEPHSLPADENDFNTTLADIADILPKGTV